MTTDLRRTRIAVAAGFFLQGLVFAAIVTQAPRIKDKFDIGDGGLTGILVLVAVLSGVGSILAGMVAERRTSATAFRLALLTIGLGALLVGLAPSLPLVVAAFVVYGLGVGAVDAGMNMQGVRVQHAYGRSVMASFHGMWSVAGIVGALYAAGAAKIDLPLALSLLIIAIVTWVVVMLAAPHFIEAQEHDPGLSAQGLDLPWRPILVFGLVILLFYAADTGILTWSSVYLEDALDSTKSVAPLAYGAYEAGALVSRFGGDHLVRRVGATMVVAFGTITGIVGLAVVVSAATPAIAIAGFFVVGLGLAILAPLSFAALAGAVPAESLDVAIARMNIANYLGAILGGGLIGAAASSDHLRWAFVIPLVLIPLVLLFVRSFRTADADTLDAV
ncbi:MFS transporter [Aeromicrobium sp. A1-2]|uniref:MFS transporter n=1 Tax=Aeromicrobium sp. A1-2 TaxID=2107713 RepID=UPI000E4FEABC|nr:MFS transporter [Aeromicrobium sp. A1-2]AXT86177.1 MFS transporter [Aeromicrobium sp. A1-2]